MKLRCLFVFFVLSLTVAAEQPWVFDTAWQSRFNTSGFDGARDATLDAAGNFIVVGQTFEEDTGADGLIVKVNPQGQRIWAKRFDSSISEDDFFSKVAVDSGGNIAVVGIGADRDQPGSFLIGRYLPDGRQSWMKQIPGKFTSTGSVGVDSSGNVLATIGVESSTNQVIRTYKFNGASGLPIWTNEFTAARDFRFNLNTEIPMLVAPSDGGCYVASLVRNINRGDLDWVVVRVAGANGALQGPGVFAGRNKHDSQPFLTYHSSGDLLLAGNSENESGGFDIVIERLRFDTGARIWQTKYSGASVFKAGSHLPAQIRSDSDGRIFLTGNSVGWGGFVSRFTADGTFEWSTHFLQEPVGIVPLPGGRSFVTLTDGVGWVDSNGCVLKYEPGRSESVPVADASGSVYVAGSYRVAESADFGLAAEKLVMSRSPLAPTFTKLVPYAGGFPSQSVELAPEVSGSNLRYFWSHNGVRLSDETSRILSLPFLDASSLGTYTLEVTNEFGATLGPDIEVLTVAPIFIRQPKVQTLTEGGDLAFSALAVGFEPQTSSVGMLTNYLFYQWQWQYVGDFDWYDLDWEYGSKLLYRNASDNLIGDFFGYYQYRVVATVVYPGITAQSEVSSIVWPEYPYEPVTELSANRSSWVAIGEPFSEPTGMALRPVSGVDVSLKSLNGLYRITLNPGLQSFAGEPFKPAGRDLPKGAHLFDSLGNYYGLGETNRIDTGLDWAVSRHSGGGQLLWTQFIGSLGRAEDKIVDGAVNKFDELVVSGVGATATTGMDFLTVCLRKEDGSVRWRASYHDPEGVRVRYGGDQAAQVSVDPNGNTYVAGIGEAADFGFYLLISYDTNGVERFVYKRPYESANNHAPLLAVDSDGSCVLAGSFGLLKLNPAGREVWVNDTLITESSLPTIFDGLQLDKAGNIYVTDYADGNHYFEKYDAFGELQYWQRTSDIFPDSNIRPKGRFALDNFGNAYLPASGGNTLIERDILLVKLDPFLDVLWSARVDGVSQSTDEAYDVRLRAPYVYLTGQVTEGNTTAVSFNIFQEEATPVKITHLTRSQTVRRGTPFNAGVQTQGTPNRFQWYLNGEKMANQTLANLNIPNIDYQHEGFYYLAATNLSSGYVGYSGGFALRVAEAPQFVQHPQSTNVTVGGEIRLAAQVNGTEPITFQWQLEGQPINGATNKSLVITGVQFENRGQYKLVASNEWGTVTSLGALVAVTRPANLAPIVKLIEPIDGVVRRNLNPVLFRAGVYDPDGRVTRVVFRVNGAQVQEVIKEPFEMMWTPSAPGIYAVTAQAFDNLGASRISIESKVVIASDPVIVQQPGPTLNIAENSDLTLTADATGTPPPRFQWRLNGANIPGATNRTYTVGGAQVKHSGFYAAIVVNEGAAKITTETEVIVSAEALVMKDKLSEALTRGDVQFTGRSSNVGATKEVGEPNHARRKGGSSVWLKWKAPASGVLSVNTRGSGIDTLLAIYSGSDVSNMIRVAADDERGGFHCSAARFNAVKDQVYLFVVDGFKGEKGNIVLSWALDSSARDLPLLIEEPIGLSPTLGTLSVAKEFQVAVSGIGVKFQWFINGYLIPGATSSNLIFNALSKTNLGNYVLRISNDNGSIETIVAQLEAGTLGGLVSQDRSEDLRPVPFGDEKPKAGGGYPTISPGIPFQQLFNTSGSTTSRDEPVVGDGGGASKWFQITAGGNGTLVADTIGSQFATTLTLHDGSNFETLPVLANGTPLAGGASQVQYAATTGKVFVMRVDGPEGSVTLNVNIGSAPLMSATPLDSIMSAGASTNLTASVTASPVATYQWYLNGIALAGKTANTLPITNFDLAQVGMYELEARNPLASVRKTIAYLELRRDTTFFPLTKIAGGGMQMRIEGNNQTYGIDTSVDLKTWTTNFFSGRAENGAITFIDPPTPVYPNRFYRAHTQ